MLEDIHLWLKPVPAKCICCDNQAAIFKAQNFVHNGESRHIRHRYNIVRQLLSDRVITIDFMASKIT